MLHFDTDYMEGAHPEVMRRLMETNLEQTSGYGSDDYTRHARELKRQACGQPEAGVYFLVGGTQTNATVIDEHMVAPGMVYISHPTEYGTLYSLSELEALSRVCRKANIPLYMDGARLGYGLAAPGTNVTLQDIARLCDVFYIGGTKVGALFGEAVVAPHTERLPHFFPLIKQHGALLAKGRLLGIQFETLFTDGLYLEMGKHAVRLAQKLKQGFVQKGYKLHMDSPTNQQFVCLPNADIDRLSAHATFELWGPRGEEETVVRFVTSWATREADVDALIDLL